MQHEPIDVAKRERAEWELPLIDTTAWIGREPPERRWIVRGWLARATGGALFGEDGIGKSLLGQQLTACVATGKPFLGLPVTQAGALYLTFEDDELSLWQRQRAINRMLGIQVDAAPAMLSSLVGWVAPELGAFDEVGGFRTGPLFRAIVARAQAAKAGLLVLDNIAALFSGNEIIRRQVVAFLAAIDRLAMECDAAVLLLGHPAKAAGSEYSGNLGWSAHVRQRWFMAWGPEGDDDARVLRKAKANLSKRGEEIAFHWRDWAFLADEDAPEDQRAEYAAIAMAGGDNALFLACLDARTRDGLVASPNVSPNYAPTQFEAMPAAKGIGRGRLRAAMERLMAIGAIEVFDHRKPGKGVSIKALRRTDPNAPRT